VDEDNRKGGRPRVSDARYSFRLPARYFALLRDVGRGNASQGLRNLIRFYRANRQAVDAWLYRNPPPKGEG